MYNIDEIKNTIINGDCLEELKKIPDESIDMVLQDPPYNTTACDWEWDIMTKIDEFWAEWKRVIKPNGAIVMTASQPFTSALVMSNVKMFKYEWIWEKHKATNFMNGNRQPMKIHENILVFYENQPTYNPQKIDGKAYKQRGKHNIQRSGVLGAEMPKVYSKNHEPDKRLPVSIQKFSNHNQKDNRFHPTQKPVALFEYLIKTYTNEGDLVFDGFIGSGTTAIACINTKRNYIGIDLSKKYCEITEKRIKAIPPSLF